ncbi:hypothetical protein AT1219_11078 [Vibrio alginolyticus]
MPRLFCIWQEKGLRTGVCTLIAKCAFIDGKIDRGESAITFGYNLCFTGLNAFTAASAIVRKLFRFS